MACCKRIFLILLFICTLFILFSSSSQCATFDDSILGIYTFMDDSLLSSFYNSPYYSTNYDYAIWAFLYSGSPHYSIILVPHGQYEYILNYNSSTHTIEYNPQISQYYSANDKTSTSDFATYISLRNNHLSDDGWFKQSTVKTVMYRQYSGVNRYFLWGTNGSILVNGQNRMTFDDEPDYEPLGNAPVLDTLFTHGGYHLYMTSDIYWYNYCMSTNYVTSGDYYYVFSQNTSDGSYVFWAISKTDPNLNIGNYRAPFKFTFNTNDNTLRKGINDIGGVTVYEIVRNSSGTNTYTFTNDTPLARCYTYDYWL